MKITSPHQQWQISVVGTLDAWGRFWTATNCQAEQLLKGRCQEELLWRNSLVSNDYTETLGDDTVSFFFRFRRCKRLKSSMWVSNIFPQADVFWFAFHWNQGALLIRLKKDWRILVEVLRVQCWSLEVPDLKTTKKLLRDKWTSRFSSTIVVPALFWLGGTRDFNCTSCYSKVVYRSKNCPRSRNRFLPDIPCSQRIVYLFHQGYPKKVPFFFFPLPPQKNGVLFGDPSPGRPGVPPLRYQEYHMSCHWNHMSCGSWFWSMSCGKNVIFPLQNCYI